MRSKDYRNTWQFIIGLFASKLIFLNSEDQKKKYEDTGFLFPFLSLFFITQFLDCNSKYSRPLSRLAGH